MNISERLNAMRQTDPECNLVAFGDLGTRLVLRSSAAIQHPQEYLDKLCVQAKHGFEQQDLLWQQDTSDAVDEVLVITPHETRVYVRSPKAGDPVDNDAILCVGQAGQNTQQLITQAKALLNDLSGTV